MAKAAKSNQKPNKKQPPKKKKHYEDSRLWKLMLFTGKIINVTSLLLTILVSILALLQYFTPPKEQTQSKRFFEQYKDTGEIKSSAISNFNSLETPPDFYINRMEYTYPILNGIYIDSLKFRQYIPIKIGERVIICQVPHLYKGINIIYKMTECEDVFLGVAAKDDRLYVSVKILDFRTENMIGQINFNKWVVYKKEALDYRENDSCFEVIDKQGQIAFSIAYLYDKPLVPAVVIAGYLINSESVLVLTNKYHFDKNIKTNAIVPCFSKSDSGWREKAMKRISEIKSVF